MHKEETPLITVSTSNKCFKHSNAWSRILVSYMQYKFPSRGVQNASQILLLDLEYFSRLFMQSAVGEEVCFARTTFAIAPVVQKARKICIA